MARVCTINAQEVMIDKNWYLNEKIASVSTFTCNIIDLKNIDISDLKTGQEIIFAEDGTNIFAGIIDEIEIFEKTPNYLILKLKCEDYSKLTKKRLITYTDTNKKAGEVIEDGIMPILAEEGVATGTIQDGVTLTKTVFNYIYANQALDKIKELTGFNWEINYDKELSFYARDTYISPWTLNNSVQHTKFSLVKNKENYRNTQYTRGGRGTTSFANPETPSPSPDGSVKNFVTRFPVASKPTIYVNDVAVPSADIGVNGFDTGKKWYYSFSSNVIAQDFEEEPLAALDTIKIEYTGLYPILVVKENTDEINRVKALETGTSGKYESIIQESNLDTRQQAAEYTEKILERYAKINSYIEFETTVTGLKVGQLLTVDKTLYGITSETFLIESIKTELVDNIVIYSVRAISGDAVGGWENFFRNLVSANMKFSISESEIIVFTAFFTESMAYTSESEITEYSHLWFVESSNLTEKIIAEFVVEGDLFEFSEIDYDALGEVTDVTLTASIEVAEYTEEITGEFVVEGDLYEFSEIDYDDLGEVDEITLTVDGDDMTLLITYSTNYMTLDIEYDALYCSDTLYIGDVEGSETVYD